jgi:hypothetical protein
MEAALYASRNRQRPEFRRAPDARPQRPRRRPARAAARAQRAVRQRAGAGRGEHLGQQRDRQRRRAQQPPADQPTSFDRHTLQGDLPPGWDVELYYNEALVGFQQSRPDGKYSFDDQPLAYGPNEFRLVFHGPLGQLRVERQSFLLEQSAVPRGRCSTTWPRTATRGASARWPSSNGAERAPERHRRLAAPAAVRRRAAMPTSGCAATGTRSS